MEESTTKNTITHILFLYASVTNFINLQTNKQTKKTERRDISTIFSGMRVLFFFARKIGPGDRLCRYRMVIFFPGKCSPRLKLENEARN